MQQRHFFAFSLPQRNAGHNSAPIIPSPLSKQDKEKEREPHTETDDVLESTEDITEDDCKSLIDPSIDLSTTIVRLNIGGHKYVTTAKTLTQNGTADNFFTALISDKFTPLKDDEGFYFVDRDGSYFRPILDYLRTGEWILPHDLPEKLVLREARFYSIEPRIYSTISDESFCESIAKKKMEFHKTQLRKHKAELKALKKHVLKSFLQQIDHRQTVESPVFVPSQEHILRIWKYYSETQYNTYNESWRNLFREQGPLTLHEFALKNESEVVFDSSIYDVLYSSSSPSEPTSSFSRGVLHAFLWNLKIKHSLTVKVDDYQLLVQKKGGTLEWMLEPNASSTTEVRGFRFVWTGGDKYSQWRLDEYEQIRKSKRVIK